MNKKNKKMNNLTVHLLVVNRSKIGDLESPSYKTELQIMMSKTELSQIVKSKLIFRNSETLG